MAGNKVQDIELVLRKSEDRILSGRRYIRPDMMQDIRTVLSQAELCNTYNMDQVAAAIQGEIDVKADYIRRNLRPLYTALLSVKDDVVTLFEEVKAELMDMYHNNEFLLKDIHQWLVNAVEWTKTQCETLTVQGRNNYARVSAVAMQSQTTFEELMQSWSQEASDLFDTLPSMDDMSNGFMTRWNALTESIRTSSTVQSILESMHEYDSYGVMDSWQTQGQQNAVATSGTSRSWFNNLAKRDDVKTAVEYVKNQLKNSEFFAQYLEVKKTIAEVMTDIRTNGLRTVRTNVMAWIENWLQTDKDSFTMGDGDIEFTLYVPLPLEDLRTIPTVNINLSQYLRQMKKLYNNYMPSFDWTLSDYYYYYYKQNTDMKELLPPFRAHASLVGDQHYMTFDKKFFEFSGDCNYLLARDFIDGTFSVVANYERIDNKPVKKSLTLTTKDKTIEIFADGHVVLDNSRVEMPLRIDGTSIIREESEIHVESDLGISVVCDLYHDHCTVEVPGWYFGKTAGLFGTYNNEPADDFTTSDHRRSVDTGDFAASWAVGERRCRPLNAAVDVSNDILPNTRRYDLCAKYFQDESSPFRKCFKVVDPSPYMTMCLNDFPTNVNRLETESDTCDTAAFYAKECQKRHVPVFAPSFCVQCDLENGNKFVDGENVTLTGDMIPDSADIVFVMEHADCNQGMKENLKEMVDELEKVLATENLNNNRYSLVGYGGVVKGGKPHVHTMNGQIFETRDKILLGMENFNMPSAEVSDTMAAVRYAAHLPFRAGVSKSIILMPCSQCRQGEATFSELQHLLLFRDINFHIMMPHNFAFKNNRNAGTAYIFGVDKETVYTRKDAGTTELTGDTSLRSQIQMPKDLCVALTEETDGSVFNTLQFTNSRPFIQKRFMDVLVRVIADKAEPAPCQICDCVPDNVGAGKAVCRSCEPYNRIYTTIPQVFNNNNIELPTQTQTEQVTQPPVKSKKAKGKKAKKGQINARKRALRAKRLKNQQ